MSNENHHPSPTPNDPPRRYLLPSAVIALALVAVVLLVTIRDDDLAATSPLETSQPATTSSTTAPLSDTENEVVTRLREILQVREQAFSKRDASLFDDVYTSSCPCLRAGRNAIAALKKEQILWQNRSISIEVQSAKSINPRLWEVVALFVSDSFRIETEEGELVREAPPERLRYRFLLVRTSDSEPWRLGSASSIEG